MRRPPSLVPTVWPTTICLVEVDATTRVLLAGFLQDAGLRVLAAVGTPGGALASIAQLAPAVAVIDQRLPGRSTLELCRTLSVAQPAVRTLIHACIVEPDTEEMARQAGASEVVEKSISCAPLLQAISALDRGLWDR